MPKIVCAGHVQFLLYRRKWEVPFSRAIGNGVLMHECFPKTLVHGNSNNEIRKRDRRRR